MLRRVDPARLAPTPEPPMRISRFLLIALLAGLLSGGAFWLMRGRELSYGVYDSGYLVESEPLSTDGRVAVTILVGLVCGLCVAGAVWLVGGWPRRAGE